MNLLANWELVLLHLAQTVLLSILLVAGSIPLLLVVGFETVASLWRQGSDTAEGFSAEAILEHLSGAAGPLLIALVVALCAWTVALIVFSYVQAGVFGILAAGERQAPAGAARTGFRSFSLAGWKRSADRLVWRFFWLVNLFMAAGAIIIALLGVVLVAVGWLVSDEAGGAAFAVGCLGGSVTVSLAVGTTLWWQLAMAALVSGASGIWHATRVGSAVLVRRLGAVTVIALIGLVMGMTVAVVFVPGAMVLDMVLREVVGGQIVAQVTTSLLQSAVSSIMSVAFVAVTISLVVGEVRIAGGVRA